MGFFSKKEAAPAAAFPKDTPLSSDPNTPASQSVTSFSNEEQNAPIPSTESEPKVTFLAILLGAIASMGGFIFGYESGQISGMSSLLVDTLVTDGE